MIRNSLSKNERKCYIFLFMVAFFVLCLVITPATGVTNIISPGDEIFIGEEGLNISAVIPGDMYQIAWFAPGTNPTVDVPAQIITVPSKTSFYVNPSQFIGETGTWYLWNRSVQGVAFQVVSPNLNLRVWDQETNSDVSGAGVPPGTLVNFRIETNLIPITQRVGYDPATDGYITVLVTTPDGATLNALVGPDGNSISTKNLNVNALPYYWVAPGTTNGWDTGAVGQTGARLYKAGVYTARLDYNVNQLEDNTQGVAGVQHPFPVQITLASSQVTLTSSTGMVTRSNPFTVTITGIPGGQYYLWVRNTASMSGAPGDQPPMISPNQAGVAMDPAGGPYTIGSYMISTRQGATLKSDVPPVPYDGTRYYALVTLSNSGTRTVQWQTSIDTDTRQYTIRTERPSSGQQVQSDEVTVQVVKGSVTIVAGATNSYYLGQQVVLSGVNTATDTTYLFMTGPNLPSAGGSLTDPHTPVVTGLPGTFTQVPVNADTTWEYKWQTGNLGVDPGVYTVYAVATPNSRNDLGNAQFTTQSISFTSPAISGGSSEPVVAQGDPITISGVATGNPSVGVAIWIFGTNKFIYETVPVNSDGTFSYELTGAETENLAPGQYYVVVQSPGYNNIFDVYPDPSRQLVLSSYPTPGSPLFRVAGPGALVSSQAADALINALDSPAIDDTYTTLQFLVVSPQVTLDPLGTYTVGDQVSITGTTNLAPGDQLLIEVTSSSFGPTSKTQSGAFSGVSATVTVQAGAGGTNTFGYIVDTAGFTPDTYLVQVSGITVPAASATGSFDLVAVTPTPTPTPSPPTTLPTPPPTTVPTTVPPTTTGLPGILAVAGVAGIAGVLWVIQRKK
jgi:hypothetical protein